ncbi:MAG: helicase-related protein [Nitrospirales bacterium]
MPPAIHPVDLVEVLRRKQLTPAIVFLTSRRACDDAITAFQRSEGGLPPARSQAIATVLEQLAVEYPSITGHPLMPTVARFGVAAHHAGHLPSWKIAIEELMRKGKLDAVFATTTLAAGVDFPARTVVITQSSVRKARDFSDLTVGEIQQLAGRGGRRGKDLVGFVIITPSPYIDLQVLSKGLTGFPEPIESQFVISYPMVLNLLKAHPLDHIEGILAKSFAQFQLNRRAEVHQNHLDTIHEDMRPFGPRVCTDWITQWQVYDTAKRRKSQRRPVTHKDSADTSARLPFLTPGRIIGVSKGFAIILRQYRSRGQRYPMLSILRPKGTITECPAMMVNHIYDHVIEFKTLRAFPWCTANTLSTLAQELNQLPSGIPVLPVLVDEEQDEDTQLMAVLTDEFPCPSCPSQAACRKDHQVALRLRQKEKGVSKTIQALRTGLWHRFQEKSHVLHQFGYLTATSELTSEGDWARLIRIDHSLLITELIRMEAFAAIEPALLAAVMAGIAHDDDRPGSFQRMSPGLSTMLHQVRAVAESLSPYEDPPLLRTDVAALTEQWISQPELLWANLVRKTAMAEGDVYRLFARTIEFLSQIQTLKDSHPSLAETAISAITTMRREVLEELP